MASAALLCPSCGARNKAKWEFCARCGESLEGASVESADEGFPAEALELDETAVAVGLPAGMVLVVGGVALAIVGLGAWRHLSNSPPPPTIPTETFTFATMPPSLAPPPPAEPEGPGAEAYGEAQRVLAQGDPAGAVELLAAALQQDPENPEYLSLYGQALWVTGDREGAIAQQAEAARLDPDRFALTYARTLDVAGRASDAALVYREVLERRADDLVAQEDLGRLLYRMSDYRAAAPLLQGAVASRPDDPVLRQEMAYALEKAGDVAGAEQAYREVLERAPQAAIARGLLADNLHRQGKTAEAIKLLSDGLAQTPDAPLLHRGLASLYERTGRVQEAVKAYEEYARLAPSAPDAKELKERAVRLAGGSGS